MGAQESANRSKPNELDVGEEYSMKSGTYRLWTHVNPCTKNRRLKGTIFSKEFGTLPEEKKCFENGVVLLKKLRHPGIISFLESSNTSNSILLMTERVQILDLCIDSLSSVEIHSGLGQVLEALIFLHQKAKISHNNICPSTIFVTPSGEWKIGGFEFAKSFDNSPKFVNNDFYKTAGGLKDFTCPEDLANSPLARDAFGFGKLIEYSVKFIENSEINADVLDSLYSLASKLVKLEEEPDLCLLLSDLAFSNHLSEITDFLTSVHLRSNEEKDDFYSQLIPRLRSLPPRVVARRLCRLAVSRYVLLEPRSHSILYPVFLTPIVEDDEHSEQIGLFPLDIYREFIIPEIVRIFTVRETSIRLGLLAHFHRYVKYIPVHQLDGLILDEVYLSAHDVDDRLVSASLQALSYLVPLLVGEKVCGWKCVKSFVDGTPKGGSSTPSYPRAPSPSIAPLVVRSETPEARNQDSVPPVVVRTEITFKADEPPMEPVYSGYNQPAMEGTSYPQSDDWNNAEDWTSDWDEREEEEEGADIKDETQNATKTDRGNTSSKAKAAEYEIPVVKKTEEEDYFADMQPVIKTNGTIIDKLMAIQQEMEKKKEQGSTALSGSKFAMSTDDIPDGGWGEEEEDGLTEVMAAVEPAEDVVLPATESNEAFVLPPTEPEKELVPLVTEPYEELEPAVTKPTEDLVLPSTEPEEEILPKSACQPADEKRTEIDAGWSE